MTEVEKRTDPIQGQIIHEYDGIEEADNDLPRWWLLTLFGAIFFAVGYWFYYHEYAVGPLPREEYAAEVAAAAESGGEVTSELIETLASSPAEVERGSALFAEHCAVCHGDKAQGNIGPNLTDNAWLHGGAPIDIHATISNGVGAKGMPAWGATLGPSAVRSLAVFVTSVRDTNVAGKEPQGEVYTGAAQTGAAAEAPAEGAPAEAAAPAEGAPAPTPSEGASDDAAPAEGAAGEGSPPAATTPAPPSAQAEPAPSAPARTPS